MFDGPHLLVGAVILTVFAASTEEVLFRGLLQHVVTDICPRSGVLWSAFLFASMYIGSLSVGYVLFMGLVGLFFGWCVRQTGSLWGVILAHGGLIVGLVCVWPFHHP
jgi:membrane protease YdiL (CAAX protease family)